MEAAAISTTGTIYTLGRHRLLVGDATQAADVARLMNGAKAHLLLTDPPYNVAYEGKTKDKLKIAGDQQSVEEFRSFLRSALSAADAQLVAGGAFYIWHPAGKPEPFFEACSAVGWPIRQHLVWAKTRFAFGRSDYHWQHEPCLYGWKPGAPHRWHGDRKQSTLLAYAPKFRNREHPTMKPVSMFERLIGNSTAPGEIVLDIFAGSGTTVLAAEATGRTAYVLEIDPHYADVIRRRWAEAVHGEGCDWASGSRAERRPAA